MSEVAVAMNKADESFSFSFEQVNDLECLADQWRKLESSSSACFFQSWDWIGCWITEAQVQPWLLVGRQFDRVALLGLLISSRQRRHGMICADALLLHQLGDKDKDIISIGYNGFVVDSNANEQIIGEAISFLRQITAVGFVELQLKSVSQNYWDHAQLSGFRRILISQNRSWRVNLQKIRHSGRAYIEYLSANTRYQIRRATRLYRTRGTLTTTVARDESEALHFFESLKELNTTYWLSRQKIGSFTYPFFERFHRRLIKDCLSKGTVELVRISAGNDPIGYLYNFVYNGTIYAYQSGFAYEDDPKLKPGLISHQLCIERHLRNGADTYDFLAGYGRYKTNLGIAGPDVFDLSLQKPTISLRIEDLLRTAKRRAISKIFSRDVANRIPTD
jgi:CelD/BcsL family acetyltransferase involved in cellulose biosynthesis